MGFEAVGGKGFGYLANLLRDHLEVFEDVDAINREVVGPYMRRQARANFATAGKHGGRAWTFDGEEKYRRMKRGWLGEVYAGLPMVVPDEHAELVPSVVDPFHPHHIERSTDTGMQMGSSLEHARALFVTGGVGPFGERFPARDPFQMTPAQVDELGEEIAAFNKRRLDALS